LADAADEHLAMLDGRETKTQQLIAELQRDVEWSPAVSNESIEKTVRACQAANKMFESAAGRIAIRNEMDAGVIVARPNQQSGTSNQEPAAASNWPFGVNPHNSQAAAGRTATGSKPIELKLPSIPSLRSPAPVTAPVISQSTSGQPILCRRQHSGQLPPLRTPVTSLEMPPPLC
jgi:hypothetical protein